MASEADHIALANRNHDTLMYLVQSATEHPEWVATVAFYKAVQIIEAVFANDCKRHSNGHDARLQELKCPKFADLFKAYRPLYSASLVARYLQDTAGLKFGDAKVESYHTYQDYMPADKVVHQLLKKRLAPLEQHAVQFLSDSAKKCLKRVDKEELVK